MKKAKVNQTIVKVNDKHSLSILTLENGMVEIAHMVDGDVSYSIFNDVITAYQNNLDDKVQEIVAEIVNEELEANHYDSKLEVDGQVIVETFTYNIWIAVCYLGGKISYNVCTTRQDDDYNDRNMNERKTWKGLLNIIERFDI